MKRNLKITREEMNLTQWEMAEKLKISEQHYQRLEAGTSKGSIDVWEKLKKITGKPIDFLLAQEVNNKEPDGNQA
jgi:transcriptional regulator with XRE-family HTH domain